MSDDGPSIAELQQVERGMTPGDWQWFGNTKMHEVYLATVDRGHVLVMDFARWGMAGAQPRFQVRLNSDTPGSGIMRNLGDLGKEEHPLGPKFEVPYRRQFVGIGHPDPNGMVALRNAAPALLEIAALALALRDQEQVAAKARRVPSERYAPSDEDYATRDRADAELIERQSAFLAALAKVRP